MQKVFGNPFSPDTFLIGDMSNEIKFQEREDVFIIELEVGAASPAVRFFMLLLILLPATTLMFFLYKLISDFRNSDVTDIVAAVLMAMVAWYFIRLLLWNRGGKEVLEIRKNKLFHYSDYGWFTLGRIGYDYDSISIIWMEGMP